jgi:hypothetical protein
MEKFILDVIRMSGRMGNINCEYNRLHKKMKYQKVVNL